ncbi:MAG TPA: RHS repeat domain-containing protein, partial [Allosphingosinicella sp.]|nr:RHS repeat domain-containing protein [Allosphingosinicella sp.]
MKSRAIRAGMVGGALLAAIALGAPALAQALPDVPPPSRYQVDENGVDVARGTMTGTRTDLAIGAAGRAGLAFLRRFGFGQGGHNYDFGLFLSAGQTQAGIGLESIPFTQSGSTYTVADGSGATLVKSGSTYTLTLSDGTIVVYNYTTLDHLDVQRFARATSITYPSGETATLTWVSLTWCSNSLDYCEGGTWLTGVRLQAVSSSMGYQLHFNYGRADVLVPMHGAHWRRLDGVTAINTTVESCDPSAHSCSLTNTWPTVTYSGNDVTDPVGRTSTYTQGTLSYTIRRPSAGTPNVAYTIASAYGRYPVTQVVRDTLTWGYNYSVTGNVATMIVTLPGSPARTRTIVSDLNVGLPTSVTNEVGQTTVYAYDASGRLTRATAPEDNYVELAYDARGNVTTRTAVPKPSTGLPNIVASAAYPASCTNPATCNQPTSTTDARGAVTDYTYNSTHGGVLTVTAPAPTTGAVRPQTRLTYSALTQPGGGSVYRLT